MAKAQTKTGTPVFGTPVFGTPFEGAFGEFMDFTKYAEQFKLPGVDSKALMESHRRNFEAMTQANQVALEGARALMQRQAEILRQAMDEASKAVRELAKPGEPSEKWATQTEMLKEAYELALANLRELAEMSAKSNTEAADVLTHRFTASLDELKGALKQINSIK